MKLAAKGGEPVRTRPWPAWPVGGEDEKHALNRVVESGLWGIGSPEIEALEKEFAEFCGVSRAVCTANGTVSLMISLKAIGVGAGDEVIVPAYTFLATAMAVVLVNAVPVFADIDPDTYCIDPSSVEQAITSRTKAVIPVHLGGHPADMDRLCALADRHGIRIIEDAAQAHGAEWKGRRVGSLGHLGSFSFQSSKNVSGGEGGAVVTNDEELYQAAWSYHNCGRVLGGRWYDHYFAAANYRLSGWQAAVIRVQLRRLQELNAKRMESAAYLDRKLAEIPGIRPLVRRTEATAHAYHLYIIRYDSEHFAGASREAFVKALNAEGIPASTGYTPLYKLPAFGNPDVLRCPLGCPLYAGERPRYAEMDLPMTERACSSEGVWLFHNLLLAEKRDLDDIVDAVAKVHENASELACL